MRLDTLPMTGSEAIHIPVWVLSAECKYPTIREGNQQPASTCQE
jgi:hypothetical protein